MTDLFGYLGIGRKETFRDRFELPEPKRARPRHFQGDPSIQRQIILDLEQAGIEAGLPQHTRKVYSPTKQRAIAEIINRGDKVDIEPYDIVGLGIPNGWSIQRVQHGKGLKWILNYAGKRYVLGITHMDAMDKLPEVVETLLGETQYNV